MKNASVVMVHIIGAAIWPVLPSHAQPSTPILTASDATGKFEVTPDGACRFSPELDRGFVQLLDEEDEPRTGLRIVHLAGGESSAVISYIRDVAGDEGASARVALLPLQTPLIWNGLAVTELQLVHAQETEVRSLVFRSTRAVASAAIAGAGINLSAINAGNGDGEGCGTSVWLEERPNGSALTCAGGC